MQIQLVTDRRGYINTQLNENVHLASNIPDICLKKKKD